ncbi:Fic family protein [Microbacterium sp. Leaf151]|uniref:Fic family protein n=1 Tax=Microbacterium sp. Leaf151 TaxID=1736276 RepID=UPI0006FCE30D|nr:cell filamentation protein Fic [Microbacterium sp. Leaf151]
MMARRYEETHPWISFQFRVEQSRIWAKLGEAFSKNQHLAGIPLQPALANELASVLLTKGALATAAIEGNTLSEAEANRVIHEGEKLPPSQEYLAQEIRNVTSALDAIDHSGQRGESFELTPEWLQAQNAKILDQLEVDDHVVPGQYTKEGLTVGSVYRGAPPADLEHLVERMCSWLNETFIRPSQDHNLADDIRFYNAVFGAVLGHLYTAWIHPFGDGNGRTARLLEVAILSHSRVVPWVASNLLSDHYNRTRSRYYARLASTSREGKVGEFVEYAVEGYVDMLREQIETVRASQMRVAWQNYVHETMHKEASGKTKDRRRELVLSLPMNGLVAKKDIRRLSPTLAEQYAGHEERMIARDMNALERLGLVSCEPAGYRARASIINAFVPIPSVPLNAS